MAARTILGQASLDSITNRFGDWAVSLGLAVFCLWQWSRGALNWPQAALFVLSALSAWLTGRWAVRPHQSTATRLAVSSLETLWVALYAFAAPTVGLELGLLFFMPVLASALRMPATVILATGCVNAVCYGALALWRGTAQASSSGLLVCVLIVLEGALLSLLVRRTQLRVLALNQKMSTLERRLFEQSILQEMSRSVHNLNIVDTLQNLVEVTTRVMGAARTVLLVADPDGRLNLAESVFSTWPGSRHSEADRLSLNEEAFASVLAGGRPTFVNNGKGDTTEGVGILAIPLTGSEGPIGVLALEHNESAPVGPGDREMLRDLASTAVLAIENSRLHAAVRRMADHDGLTDIYNHRYFQGQLRQELAKAKTADYALSLVMLDVDRFKVYNDQYGHQQGDWVLTSIARVLDREARVSQGLAARYGGDEFAVMLPQKTRDEAVTFARLLQERVDLDTATTMDQWSLPTVTVSLGVATLPDDADDAPGLLEAVDRAMYRAKSQGGNCVCPVV